MDTHQFVFDWQHAVPSHARDGVLQSSSPAPSLVPSLVPSQSPSIAASGSRIPWSETPQPMPPPPRPTSTIEGEAQPRVVFPKRGLTDAQHLVALRIQLDPRMQEQFGQNGYWQDVIDRFRAHTGTEHRTLNRALPKLAERFKAWAEEGDGQSETGRENENELVAAQREWLQFENDYNARIASAGVKKRRAIDERQAVEEEQYNMLKRHSQKRARKQTPPADSDEVLDETSADEDQEDDCDAEGFDGSTENSTSASILASSSASAATTRRARHSPALQSNRAKRRRRQQSSAADSAQADSQVLRETMTALVSAITNKLVENVAYVDQRIEVMGERLQKTMRESMQRELGQLQSSMNTRFDMLVTLLASRRE